jgi:exosortase K
MKHALTYNRIAQGAVVLFSAFALKLFYSTASADELRWILAPTTALVELFSGARFVFESHAGYISRERGFLIANSCSGVNFLITAFLMLAIKKLLERRSNNISWMFIPTAAAVAYSTTLVANTTRIVIALRLRQTPTFSPWLNPEQLHRFEGVIIYFGFLLLLFVISEKMMPEKTSGLFGQSFIPLLVYYATTLGIPLANGAYRHENGFWEHSLYVLLIPLLLILPYAAHRYLRGSWNSKPLIPAQPARQSCTGAIQ